MRPSTQVLDVNPQTWKNWLEMEVDVVEVVLVDVDAERIHERLHHHLWNHDKVKVSSSLFQELLHWS